MSLQPAVLLDRDGVINRERGSHTWRPEDFEILPDVAASIKALKESGRAVVVITNQSGIALGLYGHADVARLHTILKEHLAAAGTAVDAILYCPHHPDHGRCLCRKPGGLLVERALSRLRLDPARSVMIGDRERDVHAAESAGVRGILTEANAPLLPLLQRTVLN